MKANAGAFSEGRVRAPWISEAHELGQDAIASSTKMDPSLFPSLEKRFNDAVRQTFISVAK